MAARDSLHQALQSADPLVASTTARLLGSINDQDSVTALSDYCSNSRSYAKTAGLNALKDLDAQSAIPVFEQLCVDPNVPDDFYWYGHKGVRASAAVHLLDWGNASGEAFLQELLKNKDRVVLRDFSAAILQSQDLAAKNIQEQLTFDALWSEEKSRSLSDVAYTDASQLCSLCEALAWTDDERVDATLLYYADYYSRFVRVEAYKALIKRHGESLVQEICELANKHATDYEFIFIAQLDKDVDKLKQCAVHAELEFDRASAVDALASIDAPIDQSWLETFIGESAPLPAYAALDLAIHLGVLELRLPHRIGDELFEVYRQVMELKREMATC